MTNGPDFICIGAPKSGTTWLYQNLKLHPELALPPEKEVNFFFARQPTNYDFDYLKEHLPELNCEKVWGDWWHKRYALWRHARLNHCREFKTDWYETNLFAPRIASEYIKLFPKTSGKITGDISPNYAIMNPNEIAEIHKASPQAKILYFLRNPIERAWSEIRFEESGKWISGKYTHAEILKVVQAHIPSFKNHGDYATKLMEWERFFKDNVSVYFYDELLDNPVQVFKKVCRTLQVSDNVPLHRKIKHRINAAKSYPMSDDIHKWLMMQLKNEMLAIHERLNNAYTAAWLTSTNKPAKTLSFWQRWFTF